MNSKMFCSLGLLAIGFGLSSQLSFGETRTISVNIAGKNNEFPVSTGAYSGEMIGFKGYGVIGEKWMDCTATGKKTGSRPITLVPDFPIHDDKGDTAPYSKVQFYLCSSGGNYFSGKVTDGNSKMLHEYLDTSKTLWDLGSNHAGFKFTKLPFSRYTVLVYFNRDYVDSHIPAYFINGHVYKGTTEGAVEADAGTSWGKPHGATALTEGVNTLIVSNLTSSTLTVRSAVPMVDKARGCISGFQIVGELIDENDSLYATVDQNKTWGDLNWTYANGDPFQGEWGGTFPKITLTAAGGKITEFPPITVDKLEIVGDKAFTLELPGGENQFVAREIDFSSHTGIGTLGGKTAPKNVIAGTNTILNVEGSGLLSVGPNMRATCNNFAWAFERTDNDGVIAISGGTAENPNTVMASGFNVQIGPYYICSNSFFRCDVTRGNKLYQIDGAGADASATLFLESNCDWGLTDGSRFRNIKAIVGKWSPGKPFWYEHPSMMDKSVLLDLQIKLILRTDLTIGGLSGSGEVGDANTHTITVDMGLGPTTYSGKMNEKLVIGGTDVFSYTGTDMQQPLTVLDGGNLGAHSGTSPVLAKAPIFGENTGIQIGVDFSGPEPIYPDVRILKEVDVGNVDFTINIESGKIRNCKIPLLTAPAITGSELLSIDSLPSGRPWWYVLEPNGDGTSTLYAESRSGFTILLE